MSIERLRLAYNQADKTDREEGMVAYTRYHDVMQSLADKYGSTLYRTIAVFVSLSPNSTYHHNLRSAASVLKAVQDGVPCDDVTVATYKHCRNRAYVYATGEQDFFAKTRGPQITNFFHNIMDPTDNRWVTIDGHMSALWQGEVLTMREALVSLRTYRQIAGDVKALAFSEYILPQQMQAILWFVRKRLLNIGFDAQTDILQIGDQWKTTRNADDIEPYPFRGRNDHADIRGPAERPGAVQRLMLPGFRNSGHRGLLPSSVGMEQAVLPWEAEVLSAPRGDCSDRQGRPMRGDGKAHPEQTHGEPVFARGGDAADGNSEA